MLKRVYASDNFFELGGHRILAVRLAALVKDKLGVKMHLNTLFKAPTLSQLAYQR